MPKVVFTYLPFKALGEPIRLLLAYGGVEFEDKRISIADFASVRSTTPFGQLPVLEIDGKQYGQSFPIARYLARQHGLAGADIEEDFEIDQNVELINELRIKGVSVQYEPDPEISAKKHEEFTKNQYPALLSKLDEIIRANNGHVACSKLTWADFMFAGMYAWLKFMLRRPDLDDKYPIFKKLEEKVYSIPKVKDFADSAPVTDF